LILQRFDECISAKANKAYIDQIIGGIRETFVTNEANK